jgi:hypothetical protein
MTLQFCKDDLSRQCLIMNFPWLCRKRKKFENQQSLSMHQTGRYVAGTPQARAQQDVARSRYPASRDFDNVFGNGVLKKFEMAGMTNAGMAWRGA